MRQAAQQALLDGYAPIVMWISLGCLCLFLIIALPALFGDWWRRRRKTGPRCPRCWYNMKGVEGLRCPECGREAASPAHLLRNRRRWGWFTVALVPLAACAVGAFACVRGLDRIAGVFVPDRVLLAEAFACNWYSPSTPWAKFCVRTLEERYGWDWPPNIRRQALALEGVTTVPARFESRPIWPSGSRVRVLIGGRTTGSTLRGLSGTRVLAQFDAATVASLPPGVLDRMDVTTPMLIDLGNLDDESYRLGVTLTLVDHNDTPIISSPTTLSFAVGGDTSAALQARTDPAVHAWLAGALRTGVSVDRRLGLIDAAAIDGANQEPVPPLSVRIEHDGVVVARGTGPLTVLFVDPRAYMPEGSQSVALSGDLATLEHADLKDGSWTLILEPDIEAMLAEPARTWYNTGTVRLPLVETIRTKLPPGRNR